MKARYSEAPYCVTNLPAEIPTFRKIINNLTELGKCRKIRKIQ